MPLTLSHNSVIAFNEDLQRAVWTIRSVGHSFFGSEAGQLTFLSTVIGVKSPVSAHVEHMHQSPEKGEDNA